MPAATWCLARQAHAIGEKGEAAYRRGGLFEKRRLMMAAWAAFLTKVERPANVIDLPSKRPLD